MAERQQPGSAPGNPTSGSTSGSMGRSTGSETTAAGTGSRSGAGATDRESIRERTVDKAREVKDQIASEASTRAQSLFDAQKSRVTHGATAITHALRQAAESLDGERQEGAAELVRGTASALESISSRLENKDLDEVLYDLQDFALRRPAVVFGGALALGFIAVRFLKSSNDRGYGRRFSYEEMLYNDRPMRNRYGATSDRDFGRDRFDREEHAPGVVTYGEDL